MIGPSSWLYHTALKWPHKEAIFDENYSLSFEALYQDAIGVASWLISSDGEINQRIMIAMPSGVVSTVLYFGSTFAGQVAVPIDPFLMPEQLESIRRQINPQWVFGPSMLRKIWNDQRFLTVDAYEALSQWMLPPEQSKDLTQPDPSGLLNIVYTSGTTGQPKGVMLNATNLEAVTRGILKTLPIDEKSRIFSPLPFSHTYGLSQLWLMAKTGAALAVVPDITNMATIKKILVERHINTIAGVPYHLIVLTRRGDKEKLSSIRLVTIAGESPTRHLIEKVKISFPYARIHVMYGLTEASTRLTTLPSEDIERKEGSIGLPLDGVELKIIDDEGSELGPHEEGELIARGENISPGYWKDETLTRKTIIDGWLHTSDIVKKDEEGYYYHVGRKDFVFKSGGEKIVPHVIEKVLRGIEGVRDAAVLGREGFYGGKKICAVVVKEKGSNVTSGEILSTCQTRLDRRWVPQEVIFAEEIPKTSSGKVHYNALKERILYAQGGDDGRKSKGIDC
jgi:long-chain acyl-CoA synthetase